MDLQWLFRCLSSRIHAALLLVALVALSVSGCLPSASDGLDEVDIRFAAFYSDYLVAAGVTSRDEEVVLAPLSTASMRTMLARHSMTPEVFRKRVQLYGEQPERWKKVIALVRSNVWKKSP
ncbi:MAG: hypothetical protein FJY09_08645 [Chlorobi bacterium]|nr:hypothetical protein [Chlorobiota bacterium]